MDPNSNEPSTPTPGNALSELPSKIANINATITVNRIHDETAHTISHAIPDHHDPSSSSISINDQLHHQQHLTPLPLSATITSTDDVPVDPALTNTPIPKPPTISPTTPLPAAPGTASRKRKIELIDAFEEFRAESPDANGGAGNPSSSTSKGKSTHRTLQPFKKGKHHSIIEIKILRAISQFVADFDLNVKQCEIDEYLGFKQRTSRRARTTKTKSELVLEGKLERHPRADNARKDLKEKKRREAAEGAAAAVGDGAGAETKDGPTMYEDVDVAGGPEVDADIDADADADVDAQVHGGPEAHHTEEDYQTLRALFEPQPV